MIRLGLLSFSDGRERVHESLAPDIREHEARVKAILEATGEIELLVAEDIAHSPETARSQARRLAAMNLDGVILNIAVFAFPNYIVLAAQSGSGPYLLLGPHDSRYPGLTGLLAAGGALSQVGINHQRLWIDLDDEEFPQQVLTFGRAAAAATRLDGQVYGLIGGRSIGMYTGAAPAELWQQVFGVDVDHVDQSEIVRQARQVPDDRVEAGISWLHDHAREVAYDGVQLTPEKLDFEVRCYIALKNIVSSQQLDFVGLKCHFDLSEFFSVQCLGAALLNDPYDWEGAKEPVPLACEADSDGALTMQMMKLVSGRPSCLLDLRFFDPQKSVYVLPNCGAAPTWFAARSPDPSVNLAQVRIAPCIRKYAGGGAHVEFVFAPGPLTLARLTRSPDGYRITITKGEAQDFALGEVTGANPGWPHAFVSLDVTPAEVVETLQANHIHAVAGDYRAELAQLGRILDIETVILGDM
jgi:L-fucose isomerase